MQTMNRISAPHRRRRVNRVGAGCVKWLLFLFCGIFLLNLFFIIFVPIRYVHLAGTRKAQYSGRAGCTHILTTRNSPRDFDQVRPLPLSRSFVLHPPFIFVQTFCLQHSSPSRSQPLTSSHPIRSCCLFHLHLLFSSISSHLDYPVSVNNSSAFLWSTGISTFL